ncbi:MAG: hypothetical protein VX733_11890 [Candidatus Latescibacterota bacterium]|nr:hypothetical protein [Candidatus Latescibacterota bacterium]
MASRTLLFVDDHHILYRSGTRRRIVPFERYDGNPVLAGCAEPWEVLVGWNSIHRDPDSGRYQLWYQVFTGGQMPVRTQDTLICYAESEDGLAFNRPQLELHTFPGRDQTNIIGVGNGGHSYRYTNAVICHGHKDLAPRYKMASFDFPPPPQRTSPGLYTWTSADGIHWQRISELPVSKISYSEHDVDVPFAGDPTAGDAWPAPLRMSDGLDLIWDPERQVYAIYGKMWIDGPAGNLAWKHGMGRIESADFTTWSKPQLLMTPDDDDPPWVEFHSTPVFYYAGCYFGLIQILDRVTNGGVIDIELIVGRDGLSFDRPFRDTSVLPRAEGEEQFDSGSLLTNATPVILKDEIRFYYGGYSAGCTGGDDWNMVSGVGMARIPRDRFAGIQPVERSDQPTLTRPLENIGQVTLKPIQLSSYHAMRLNADASTGSIRVELLDEDGHRISGFSASEAVPVTGDDIGHEVVWDDRTLRDLPSGQYMIRIHLDNSEVFALRLV